MSTALHEWAIAYARAGLSIHPLPRGEKKSRLPWAERQRVRMTPKEAQDYWSGDDEHANIAIITGALSGVVVVDVDPSHGGDPKPFEATTPVVARTRSGGWHFYYAHPGHHVKSVAGPNPSLPGVDVRGDGGYVVAPPSRVDPGRYAWDSVAVCAIEGTRYGLPSFATIEHLIFPKREDIQKVDIPDGVFIAHDTEGWVTKRMMMGADLGEQRQVLCQLAGYFAGKGVPSDVTYATLFSWVSRQRQKLGDPWQPHHVQDLVESIYEREAKRAAVDPLVGSQPTTAGAPPAERGSTAAVGDALRLRPVALETFMLRWEGHRAAWTVEDWLPQSTVAMVQSPPGAFKTWLLIELGLSVAMGEPFLGTYPVHVPGPVLFVQQEDPEPLIAERVGALAVSKYNREGHDGFDGFGYAAPKDVPFYLVTDASFNFGVREAREALHRRIEELRPSLVILDPLYTMCPLGQFFQEMPQHFQWLKWLRNRYGTSFLVAHHTKKVSEMGDQGREQMWGSNLMNAAIESGWIIRPTGEASVVIRRHFKVASNKERRKFDFSIDVARVPAMTVVESDPNDPAVAQEEQRQLDELHELILATLREGPLGLRPLSRKIDRKHAAVQRHVQRLVDMGLVVRDDKKLLSITRVNHKEVA